MAATAEGKLSGQLRIRARRCDGETVVSEEYRSAPFHVGQQSNRAEDGRAEFIVQGVGPGHLPGDHLAVDLRADDGATLVVRGQGANRIYSTSTGIAATAEVSLNATGGGTLVYLPGEIIPYRASILEQRTVVRTDASSRVAIAEVVTAGRIGMGERFDYRRVDIRAQILVEGKLCLQERMLLEPGRDRLDVVGRQAGHLVSATLYLVGSEWNVPTSSTRGEIVWAAGQGNGFIIVRALGDTAQHVNRVLIEVINEAGFELHR